MTDLEKIIIDGCNLIASMHEWNHALIVAGYDNSGMDEAYRNINCIVKRLEDADPKERTIKKQ